MKKKPILKYLKKPMINNHIKPRQIKLEASSICQLRCPSCPNAKGIIQERLGTGILKYEVFKELIDQNPYVSKVELSNWGEIFLNPELIKILKYGYQKGVALTAKNGVNFNTVDNDTLEALVKYQFRSLTCSIDGACQESYSAYRRGGNFDQVIQNIKKLNRYKKNYGSVFPHLSWQYIVFGHNENEIETARRMARGLNMEFSLKLSWNDLYTDSFSPVKNKALIRRKMKAGVASRDEYNQKYSDEYALRNCCLSLWKNPQINYDGRFLGCPINHWADYGYICEDSLYEGLNNNIIVRARNMLMGKTGPDGRIPCLKCHQYAEMTQKKNWITLEETDPGYVQGRILNRIENRFYQSSQAKWLVKKYKDRRRRYHGKAFGYITKDLLATPKRKASSIIKKRFHTNKNLSNGMFSLQIPLPSMDEDWKSYPWFKGKTKGLHLISGHASSLKQGCIPHPPHKHSEEEILFLLSGQVDIIFSEDIFANKRTTMGLKPGELLYYPVNFSHTLQTKSQEPATYLMFKWVNTVRHKQKPLEFGKFCIFDFLEPLKDKNFETQVLFDGPTQYLHKLHCHTSMVKPGAGYDEHIDAHDVVIIVLEGEVETLGKRARPFDVIFYPSGKPHGMHNPGDTIAKYVVFEFHGRKKVLSNSLKKIKKMMRLKSWKRRIKKTMAAGRPD